MKQRLLRTLSILCVLALLTGCMALTASAAQMDVTKVISVVWDDEDNYDGFRPNSVDMIIGTETVTLSAANDWSGTATVPADATWTVADVDHYSSNVAGTDVKTVTYTHKVAAVSVSASVTWDDQGKTGMEHPDFVWINLLADGTTAAPKAKAQAGSWTASWSGLPQYKKNTRETEKISYTIKSVDKVSGYTVSVNGNEITYKLETGTLKLNVALSDIPEGTDLNKFEVQVDGPEPGMPINLKYTDLPGGSYTFPTPVVAGAYIARVISGDIADGYSMNTSEGKTQVGAGAFVTSREAGELKLKYAWEKTKKQEENETPDKKIGELEFRILGPDGYEKIITYSSFTDGKATLEDLAPGTYVVIEKNPEGLVDAYTLQCDESTTGTKFTISRNGETTDGKALFNKYKQVPLLPTGTIDIPVVKIWNDNDNEFKNRPGSIEVILYKIENNQRVDVASHVLTKDEKWNYVFENLDAYDAEGNEIEYFVEENIADKNVRANYTTEKDGFVITNTEKRDQTEYAVKVWDDDNNAAGIRPSKIAVTLKPIGRVYILEESNGWSATADNLPEYYNGKTAEYTWEEQEVVGYVKSKTTSGNRTTFTNRIPKVPKIPPDEPQPEVPGDTWFVFEEYATALGGEILINHVGDCFD